MERKYYKYQTIYTGFCTSVNGLKRFDVPILLSDRKTGFLSLCMALKSGILIFDKFIDAPTSLLQFLPTYKCSQDHLELFLALYDPWVATITTLVVYNLEQLVKNISSELNCVKVG